MLNKLVTTLVLLLAVLTPQLFAAYDVFLNQPANTIMAAPNGSAGTMKPRLLVAADIPSLSGTYLALSGGTMSGAIAMGTNQITGLGNPTNPQDAATKTYVDSNFLGTSLNSAQIFVGSAGNVATARAMSGDATLSNLGALTLASVGAGAGSCTSCNLSIDAKGRVTAYANGSGGGGSSIVSPLEVLEQKLENERYVVGPTDPLDGGVGTGFGKAPADYLIKGVLMSPYTGGGGTIDVLWNPSVLSTSDPNTSTTTGWSAFGAAGSVTTSGTIQVGTTTALQFDKTNAGTDGAVQFDYGSNTFGVNGRSTVYLNIYLPSVVGLANVTLYVTSDNTNIEKYATNVNSAGGALVGGQYNNVKFDLTTGGSSYAGTGWSYLTPFRYIAPGVETTVGVTTYSGLKISGFWFKDLNTTKYVQKGYEFDAYDDTNAEVMQIDAASSAVDGPGVTLAAAMTNSYVGGIGSAEVRFYRNSLGIGHYQAAMAAIDQGSLTLAGAQQFTQAARVSRVLRSSLAAKTVGAVVDVSTPQIYLVTAVSPGSVDVYDPGDTSLDLLSGTTMIDFESNFDGGVNYGIKRSSAAMNANATHSGSTTTLSFAANPAGIAVGDYIAKHHLAASYSVTAAGANESFTANTPMGAPDDVILQDLGTAIPQQDKVWAYWSLGGAQGTVNNYGPGKNLIQVGSLTNLNDFFAGLYSSSGFVVNTNFYGLSLGDTVGVDNQPQLVASAWVYPTTTGTSREFIGTTSGGGTVGWAGYIDATLHVVFGNASGNVTSSAPLNLNAWNHIVVQYQSGITNGTQIWQNGALTGTGTFTVSSSGQGLGVGQAGNPISSWTGAGLASTDKEAQVVLWTGTQLTPVDIAQLNNNGKAQALSPTYDLKYRYSDTPVTGQHITQKAELSRDTINVTPSIRKMGIIDTD